MAGHLYNLSKHVCDLVARYKYDLRELDFQFGLLRENRLLHHFILKETRAKVEQPISDQSQSDIRFVQIPTDKSNLCKYGSGIIESISDQYKVFIEYRFRKLLIEGDHREEIIRVCIISDDAVYVLGFLYYNKRYEAGVVPGAVVNKYPLPSDVSVNTLVELISEVLVGQKDIDKVSKK
jgi:hypothetical protein